LFLRLTQGPVSLDAMLQRIEALVETSLAEVDGSRDVAVHIGSVELGLGNAATPAPGFFARDVVLRDEQGRFLAEMPSLRLGFRPLDALRGRLRLSGVSVDRPRLRLSVGTGVSMLTSSDTAVGAVAAVIADLARTAPPLLGTLRRITLSDAAIELAGPADATQLVRSVDATMRRQRDGVAVEVTLPVPGGGTIRGQATRAGDGHIVAELTLRDTPARGLAPLHPSLAGLAALDAPVGGLLRLTLSPEGRVGSARISAAFGPGHLPAIGAEAPVRFEALEITAGLDVEAGRLAVERLVFRSHLGNVSASGTIEPLLRGGEPAGATVVLALEEALLPIGAPVGDAAPVLVRFDGGSLVARLGAEPFRLDVAEFFLHRGALTISAAGWLTARSGRESYLGVEGRIRNLSVSDLKTLWPPAAAPGALRWVRTHLETGQIETATFSVAGPLADPAFALDFAFRDTVARPLPPLPPITGDGRGSVTRDGFVLMLAEGGFVMPGDAGGRVALDGSVFRIDAFDTDPVAGRISLLGEGPAAAMLSVIDSEPLVLLDALPLSPGAVGGAARVAVDLTVPLLRDLRLEEVEVSARATLTDTTLSLAALRPGLTLTADRLGLEADTARLRLQGAGRAGSMTVDIDWREEFSPQDGASRSRLSLTGAVDPGLLGPGALPEGVTLSAAVPVALTLTRDDAPGVGFGVEADLGQAGLAVPALAWSKPRGGAASLSAAGRWTEGGTRVDRLSLRAGALDLRGSLRLDASGAPDLIVVDRLRIGQRTDIAGRLERTAEGFDGMVTGDRLDASGLVAVAGAEGGKGPSLVASLRFEIGRLLIGEGRTLHHAVGQVNHEASGALDLSVAGSANGAAPVTLDLMRQADGHGRLTLRSSDAGGLLREAGLFRRGLGGRLRAEARLVPVADGPARLAGEASIDGITVGEDGALDRLLEGADLEAALVRLEREGIRFDRVHAPFQWQGNRLSVLEAVAHGPVVGLTVSGDYDAAADRLAMQGVFTPLYGLNSLVGNVPLVGPLLTGGEGQGLIAFTFSMTGPAAAPEVSINPLSALLPGVLRQIIRPTPAPG
jgi:hypothetical protein